MVSFIPEFQCNHRSCKQDNNLRSCLWEQSGTDIRGWSTLQNEAPVGSGVAALNRSPSV